MDTDEHVKSEQVTSVLSPEVKPDQGPVLLVRVLPEMHEFIYWQYKVQYLILDVMLAVNTLYVVVSVQMSYCV